MPTATAAPSDTGTRDMNGHPALPTAAGRPLVCAAQAEDPLPAAQAAELRRTGTRLEYATLAWNVAEAAGAVGAGLLANSLVLVAFGLGSCIEVLASLVVLWHLRRGATGSDGQAHDAAAVTRVTRTLAVLFGISALYILAQAGYGLAARAESSPTLFGVAFMTVTVTAMVVLGLAKRRVGRKLGDAPLTANGTMTLLDGALGSAVLASLLVTLTVGWWWVDAASAAFIAVLVLREARQTWNG